MRLFEFDFQSQQFAIDIDTELQLEKVFIDGVQVSTRPLDKGINVHSFSWAANGGEQPQGCKLQFGIHPETKDIHYELWIEEQLAHRASCSLNEDVKSALFSAAETGQKPASKAGTSLVALGGIAFKLLKSVKVLKVGLAALALGAYSIIFTFEFALALIAVLVFHEYGHLRAMKKFGIPTKGMYLIPFVGGFALGDKPKTQWEDLYISMMGPVFGLLMSGVFFVIYLVTESHFCGLVASISAFINLINLLPVYPLDGGRIIKALVFSYRNKIAFFSLLVVSAACLFFSWKAGLVFLTFFIVLGVLDLITSWSVPLSDDLVPLKPYGIVFSLVWYFAVVGALLVMILVVAQSGLPGSELVTTMLKN